MRRSASRPSGARRRSGSAAASSCGAPAAAPTRPCRPQQSQGYAYHLTINPVITATPTGARAISTLLTITNDTNNRGDIVHWEGGYEDTFEKTPAGWKFKSRVHVWPEVAVDGPRRGHAAAQARGRVSV